MDEKIVHKKPGPKPGFKKNLPATVPQSTNLEITNPEAELKRLRSELNLANNKNVELTKIVESMKGQYANLEKQLNTERIKNQQAKEYILDAIKHAYISATMAAKGGI